MFPMWNRDGRLETKSGVRGVSVSDSHKAYPVSTLRALRVVNDRVAGRDVVIVSSTTSSDFRVYERDGQDFQLPLGPFDGRPGVMVDENGETWTARYKNRLQFKKFIQPGLVPLWARWSHRS